MRIIWHYLATFVVFVIIDFVWLGVIAKSLYREQLGALMRTDPIWSSAILFYALYVAGILWFVVYAKPEATFFQVFLSGAFFGLVAYATFDLTAHAVLDKFPGSIVPIDLVWGALLTGTVAVCAKFIGSKLL